LGEKKNLQRLQKIFPIIATTCISAHRLGEPEPMFDMVIMDEASQCNTAVSLVPILRGSSLMLVGDPQQLSPVILLDELVNERLKKRYNVSEEYDYRKNSIYKVYLACDAVSDEILLHNHYRCHPSIIEFNNRKYYNSRLQVRTDSQELVPLEYLDMGEAQSNMKNTAPAEARAIAEYAAAHRDRSIGIITPFVNQKQLIEQALKEVGVTDVTCGTVHAFQGDEKDVVLFSTAITDQTQAGTYEWLKNNKELINVATSRAKDKLIVLGSQKNLSRLHQGGGQDDLYELVQYVRSNGQTTVTPKKANSRALGVKPFSTATEEAFLQNLSHALGNIWLSQSRYAVHKEVPISQVFQTNDTYDDLFYSGRFDFV
ncbi:MAG: DNA2/NAM7 family helicase, partial [Acetatifactor sp.]|nr:DNA2/NAM7 family helicase [Acetatifactor sp.]